ncbi:hypothetical protein cypCar_00050197, partial [Cyprinus carpio]
MEESSGSHQGSTNTPVISHWIQTQHTLDSFCLRRTE